MESDFVSLPALFEALTVKLNIPCASSVPEITPVVAFSVRPPGRLPLSTLHVMGATPTAARVSLYAVSGVPFGRAVVVMTGDIWTKSTVTGAPVVISSVPVFVTEG